MSASLHKELAHLSKNIFGAGTSEEDLVDYLQQLEQRKISFNKLLEKFCKVTEYTDVILPIDQEITHTYHEFLFRSPTTEERFQHINNFYQQLHSWELRTEVIKRGDIRTYLGIRPLKLEMDIVNQCNLRCIMCHFSSAEFSQRKKVEMSLENFAKIAEQIFPLCAQVSLSISTEPLLHSQLEEILNITGKYQIPFLYMYSNGQLFTEKLITKIVESQMNHISISIDAATQKTYETIRIGGKFARLIANIKAINRAKERMGSDKPHLCFNVVLMRSNIMELPAIIELAHQLKVETVAAVHMVPLVIAKADPKEESLQWHKSLSNQKLAEAKILAEKYQINLSFPEPFAEENQNESQPLSDARTNHRDLVFLPPKQPETVERCCDFPWHFIGLDFSGNVIPCGTWYNQLPMGNIFTEPFAKIWNNEQYQTLRNELLNRKLREVCQICPALGMGNMNSSNAFLER